MHGGVGHADTKGRANSSDEGGKSMEEANEAKDAAARADAELGGQANSPAHQVGGNGSASDEEEMSMEEAKKVKDAEAAIFAAIRKARKDWQKRQKNSSHVFVQPEDPEILEKIARGNDKTKAYQKKLSDEKEVCRSPHPKRK